MNASLEELVFQDLFDIVAHLYECFFGIPSFPRFSINNIVALYKFLL